MTTCPKCHHTHAARNAIALSRFTGLNGYRTADGSIYETREDAQVALCEQRQKAAALDQAQTALLERMYLAERKAQHDSDTEGSA